MHVELKTNCRSLLVQQKERSDKSIQRYESCG